MATFTLMSGADNFTGNNGENNTFFLTPATLQFFDIVTGTSSAAFIDIIQLTDSGTITASQFSGVTNIEDLLLSGGGNAVTLSNGLVAGASGGIFNVIDGGGNDIVDGSGVTNGITLVFFAGAGSDTFKGGSGDDVFVFTASDLTSADTLTGGSGFDKILLSTAGTVAASAFANVTGVEALALNDGGSSVTLTNGLVAGSDVGYFSISSGAGNDVVDASGVNNNVSVLFFAAGGSDTFIGSSAADAFVFTIGDLTAADTVTGGAGIDTLWLSGSGSIAAADFSNVSGVELLELFPGDHNIALSNSLVAGSGLGYFSVADGPGNDVVDASGVTNGVTVIFYAVDGNDTFIGGNGPDAFVVSASNLTSGDTIQGGGGNDTLWLGTSGTFDLSALANVTGIESVVLNAGGNTLALTNASVTGSILGEFFVVDRGGNDVVDASGVTNGASIVFEIGGGTDTFIGGNGADAFVFAPGSLTAADGVHGGGGFDTLIVSAPGTVSASDVSGVSGIEVVELLQGGSIGLANGMTSTGTLFAVGTGQADTFDGSAVTGYDIHFVGSGGADTETGGGGNDQFLLPDSNFALAAGNGGLDRIILTSAAQSFDLTANAAKITNVEVIDLTSSAGASLSLTGDDIPQVSAASDLLYVVGDAGDFVDAGGGWTELETNHTNNAVAPGHTFIHLHHTNGSDLYVDTGVSLTFTSASGSLAVDDDSATVVEDFLTTASGNVLANDSGVVAVTTTGTFHGAHGDLVLNADGSYTYTLGVSTAQAAAVQALGANAAPIDAFTYTASDGVTSASGNLNVTIHGVNDAPVANAAGNSVTGNEDAIITGAVPAGSDIDDATPSLGYQLVSGPSAAEGALTFNTNGTFSFTPAVNFNGPVGFTYRVVDPHGAGSDPQAFTINVTPVNDAPVAINGAVSTQEDTPYSGTLPIATDVDGNALTYAAGTTAPTLGGVVVHADGTFTYTPAANANGTDTFSYTVTDGLSAPVEKLITVTIGAVDDPPVAAAAGNSVTGNEDTTIAGAVPAGSDIDDAAASLTYQLVAGPSTAEGALTFNPDGTFSFTLTANFNGAVDFTYRVVDPHGAHSDPQTFTITVNPVNDAPVAADGAVSTQEDTPYSGTLPVATDVDGDALTYAAGATAPALGGVVVHADGTFTYTPAANSNGTDTFSYTVTDGFSAPVEKLITVTIGAVNDAPVANADSAFTTPEDTPVILNVLANDTDVDGTVVAVASINGTAVTVGNTVAVTGGAVTLNADQTLTFTPNLNSTVDAFFVYTVRDNSGAESAQAMVTVDVTPVNDPPTAAPDAFTTLEDTAVTFNVLANDFDVENGTPTSVAQINGSAATVGVGVAVTGGTVTLNANQTLTFTPTPDSTTAGSFTYTARDGGGALSGPATVTVNVTAVDDAPVAAAAGNSASGNEDTVITGSVPAGSDIDDATLNLTYQVVSGPSAADGALTFNPNGTFSFTPIANFNGDVHFTYQVSDPHGAHSAPQDFVITVNPVNDLPVVDLNGTTGVDRTDIPTYTSGATPIDVAPALSTAVTDVEGTISAITLTLGADVGSLNASEGLYLPAGAATFLQSIGFTVSGEGTDTLEIASTTPGGISPSVFEGILKTVLYGDNDTTFGFDPEDRTITVTATDGDGGTSLPAHVHIDLAANVTDTSAGDGTFAGANLADTIRGGAGNDTMEGRGGDDIIYGGTEAGDAGAHDVAVFTGNQADYIVTPISAGVFTVQDTVANRDGTDTVHGIEVLHFNGDGTDLTLNQPIRVFDASGHLLATFDASHLADAVSYANTHANGAGGADVIEIDSGSYTASNMTITEAVTIHSVGGTATISTAGNGFIVAESAVHGATDTVRLQGLAIAGDGTTPDTVGVSFNGTYGGTTDGAIELVATSASGFGQDGVAIIGGGSGLTVTINGDDPNAAGTQTVTFAGSGYNASSGGSGDLLFFGFTGNAALGNIAVTGTTGTAASSADHGIQFAGYDPADASIDYAIGNISLDNVSVSGTYEKTLLFIQGYDDLSGLHFTSTQIGSTSGTQTTWTGLYITGAPTGISYAPDGSPPSTIDLTGVTYAGGTFGTSLGFAQFGGRPAVLIGTPTADTITGADGSEVFYGTTGDDSITGGGGSDLIIYNVGDGHDTVAAGNDGVDTLALVNLDASLLPSATPATFVVNEDTGSHHLLVDTDGTGPHEVDASGIESLQVQFGSGGDSLTLTGDLADEGIATGLGGIVVVGGSGADTLDASGLISANAIATGPGGLGGGADSFNAANVVANDNVDGNAGTDTADYSAATSAVTINLTGNSASGASVGNDTISNFENATGGAGDDSITGTSGANTLVGGDGADTFTGLGGGDTIYGGTATGDTSLLDAANYSSSFHVNFDPFQTIGPAGADSTASDGANTDQLHGVEFLHVGATTLDLTERVFLYDHGGHLIGTFHNIQDAVTAADASGETIKVRDGTYTEQVHVGAGKDGLQIIGQSESGVVIHAPTSGLASYANDAVNGRALFGVVTVNGSLGVTVQNLSVDGDEQAGQPQIGGGDFNGVVYVNASGTVDHVTIDEIRDPLPSPGHVSGNQRGNALHVSNTIGSPNDFTLTDSTIEGFQKTGAVIRNAHVTLTDNHVDGFGAQTGPGSIAQNGIQLSNGVTGSVTDNHISGIGYDDQPGLVVVGLLVFNGDGLAVSGNEYTGTSVNDVGMYFIDSNGGTIEANTIDTADYGIIDVGTIVTPNDTVNTGATANVYTNVDLINHDMEVDPATQTTVIQPVGSEGPDFYVGGASADTLDGRGGDDFLQGNGGADIILGGAGDDSIAWNAGDGNDNIDGGADTDTLYVEANGHDLTLAGGTGNFTISQDDDAPNNTAQVSNVEDVDITLSGGETVAITGDFTGTGISQHTITVDGSGGSTGETVDASAMSAAHPIDVAFTGGSGNDTFKSGPGDDTFTAGGGTDIAVYAETYLPGDIAVSGTSLTVTTAAHGADTLSGVEQVQFSNMAVLFVDNGTGAGPHYDGAYTSIDAALTAADAIGTPVTIMVAAGTYTLTSPLAFNKDITLRGANHGIAGTDPRGPETIIDGTGLPRVFDLADHALNVIVDGVSVKGDHVFDEGTPGQTLTIADSLFDLTTNAANSFYFGYGGGYDFTFSDNAVTATGYNELFDLFEGGSVHLTDNHFTGLAGAYTGDDNDVPLVFNLSSATGEVTGNTFSGVDIGVLVANDTGPLDISGNTFEHMHRVPGTTAGGFAAGVVFFTPSPFTNEIDIHGNSFSDMDAGIRTSGVPGSTVAGSDIAIDDNQFTDVAHVGYQPVGGVLHFTDSTISTTVPVTTETRPSEFFGGTSDDTIDSTTANDIVHGNSGLDRVNYHGSVGAAAIVWNGSTATVTTASDGTDTLDGVERLHFADHDVFLVGSGSDYSSIQAAINAASAGDEVLAANGTYNENVTLKDGVNLIGESEAGVVINGSMITPATMTGMTISNVTVHDADAMLLDMTATQDITDTVFDHVTFALTGDFTGALPIGNGQVSGTIALHDGADAGNAGLTFQHVTMASNDHAGGSTAFVYTLMQSIGGAELLLDDVTLSGTAGSGGLGAQWNMSPQDSTLQSAAVEIENSHTSGGGNYYVSGFDAVSIHDNVFDGQGVALNGDKNADVTGNLFENIDGTYTANGTMHRGLVIEDAYGSTGDANITVTGNTFDNISTYDGAIALQRFTDGTPTDTATIDRLSNVDIEGNTFTNLTGLATPTYLSSYFTSGDVLPSSFTGAQLLTGTTGNDTVTDTSTGAMAITTGPGDDTINGGAGSDALYGGDGIDTATGYSASATIAIARGSQVGRA